MTQFFRFFGLVVALGSAIAAHHNPMFLYWIISCMGFLIYAIFGLIEPRKDYRGKVVVFAQSVGVTMNMLVIFSNGGYMPVNFPLRYAPTGCWRLALPTDKFLFFCDRFGWNWGVFSIGDVLIIGSILLLLVLPIRKETNGNSH